MQTPGDVSRYVAIAPRPGGAARVHDVPAAVVGKKRGRGGGRVRAIAPRPMAIPGGWGPMVRVGMGDVPCGSVYERGAIHDAPHGHVVIVLPVPRSAQNTPARRRVRVLPPLRLRSGAVVPVLPRKPPCGRAPGATERPERPEEEAAAALALLAVWPRRD